MLLLIDIIQARAVGINFSGSPSPAINNHRQQQQQQQQQQQILLHKKHRSNRSIADLIPCNLSKWSTNRRSHNRYPQWIKVRGGSLNNHGTKTFVRETTCITRGGNVELSTANQRSNNLVKVVSAVTVSALVYFTITHRSQLLHLWDTEAFKIKLLALLQRVNSWGFPGIILYSFSLMTWEALGLPTTPVETTAGMSFGTRKALLASFIGKTSGKCVFDFHEVAPIVYHYFFLFLVTN